MTREELADRQTLPLDFKIRYMKCKITEFYEEFNGQVYVAYSGGKDSEFLLHVTRLLYPEVPAVFCDTGLEFPEIREHVKSRNNVVWLKPKKRFDEIINEFGYPVVSKEVSMALNRYRTTKSEVQRRLRLHGGINPSTGKKQTSGIIPDKWKYLIDAPFKISEQCCHYMKKAPFTRYERETGRKPVIGTMAIDSQVRRKDYLKFGCNAFSKKKVQSRPMSIFLEEDVWRCLKLGISYCSIYCKGYDRTGCMFCLFGLHMEGSPNRFELMKVTHPKIYEYCMNELGLAEVIEWVQKGAKK